MFKKKPAIKPLAPLKSSDRRRLADEIIAKFGLTPSPKPHLPANDAAAASTQLTALRRAVLPEALLSARFTTTAGPELRPVSGTLYVGTHEGLGGEQRVLWARVDERIYPTVYTLWSYPRLVPLLHTPAAVVEKLQTGADLMTPGLQRGPPFPRAASMHAIVAVASLEAPTVPVAVGTCLIDVGMLDSVQGLKGHAVATFHWAGDALWSWSASGVPGADPPETLPGWIDDGDLAVQTESLRLNGDGGGVSLAAPASALSPARNTSPQPADNATAHSRDRLIGAVEEAELTTQEIDDAFKNAFLYGVRHHMSHNKDHATYGFDFPLSQSHVMAQLVQPFLPTYSAARIASLQIRRTSWKNIKKFIKYLDKQTIVKSKDRDGNEVVILDIDFNDRQIDQFVPYRLPKKETPPNSASSNHIAVSTENDAAVGQRLKLVSLLRPKEKLAPIFQASDIDHRGLFTVLELRNVLVAYIEAENLIDVKNKRLVKVNPEVADCLLGSSSADNAILATGSIARDALTERMVNASSPFYAILRNDASIIDTKPKAGVAPKVHITLETRSGNKTITKVHGLEPYFISPQPLAEELRKACAGSTSVDKLQGSSPKNPVMEVLVQGPQKEAVVKALEKRGVHRNWVEFVDKTKSKKK